MEDRKTAFIKLVRSKEAEELMKKPDAFLLLTQIALRARRSNDLSVDNLKIGEAKIGDYKNIGLTERRYRTAKRDIQAWGLATFKATNRGTIAKLANKRVYDINEEAKDEPNDRQETSWRRSGDELETTNKNIRIKEYKNKEKIYKKEKSDFEEVYRLYHQSEKIRVIPFDKNKTRFENCIKQLGSAEELKKQITDYLQYLKVAHWRQKKSFDAWINSPEHFAADWKHQVQEEQKTTLSSKEVVDIEQVRKVKEENEKRKMWLNKLFNIDKNRPYFNEIMSNINFLPDYLSDITFSLYDGKKAYFITDRKFTKGNIEHDYSESIKSVLKNAIGRDTDFVIYSKEGEQGYASN